MKIFVSWSGNPSLAVATVLREWLLDVFTGVKVFVSKEDIRKGKQWMSEISQELNDTNFGIACLTQDNMTAPWLLFEAGALSKHIKESAVCTLLLGGLRPGDVEGPLSHLQHTIFEKDDVFRMIKDINNVLDGERREEGRLKKLFDKYWTDLETNVAKALKTTTKAENKRKTDDMLYELLETTNFIARNLHPEPRTLEEHFLAAQLGKGRRVWPGTETIWGGVLTRLSASLPAAIISFLSTARTTFTDNIFQVVFPFESELNFYKFYREEPARKKLEAMIRNALAEMNLGENCEILFSFMSKPAG
jgi:hypothetical protein